MSCRINKRQEWTGKILLEQYLSIHHKLGNGWFVTLTYKPEELPAGYNLCKEDVQKFIKRLRKNTGSKWRYFVAGEYGKKEPVRHPHYHLALFNQESKYSSEFNTYESMNELIAKTWQKGFTSTYELLPQRAQYLCGYATKKLIKREDKVYNDKKSSLYGRVSEFGYGSNKPGLGMGAIKYIVECYERYGLISPEMDYDQARIFQLTETGCFRINGTIYPLSRTMKELVSGLLGLQFNGEDDIAEIEQWETAEQGRDSAIREVFKNQEAKARTAYLRSEEGMEHIEKEARRAENMDKYADRRKKLNPQGI